MQETGNTTDSSRMQIEGNILENSSCSLPYLLPPLSYFHGKCSLELSTHHVWLAGGSTEVSTSTTTCTSTKIASDLHHGSLAQGQPEVGIQRNAGLRGEQIVASTCF